MHLCRSPIALALPIIALALPVIALALPLIALALPLIALALPVIALALPVIALALPVIALALLTSALALRIGVLAQLLATPALFVSVLYLQSINRYPKKKFLPATSGLIKNDAPYRVPLKDPCGAVITVQIILVLPQMTIDKQKYPPPFHFCPYICSMDPGFYVIIFLLIVALAVFGRRLIHYYKDHHTDGFSLPFEFILQNRTHFYSRLPADMKKRFLHRLDNFIESHDFEGHQGLTVTDDMRVLISAAAIHLTLGLNDYELRDFQKIFVYPDVYYSGYSKTINRGETNPHGIIALTWPYVEGGFADITDKMNLGYHEFAHALILQHVSSGLDDEMFALGYERFCYMLHEQHLAQHIQDAGFMRDYAFTNKMEFFAASAEHFLEAPEELREKSSELYYLMVRMLRQDPTHQYYGLTFTYNQQGV